MSGGVGYAYEYAGDAIERMTMDERMTICNMSIEGGARVGYVNPDRTTFDYLKGRPFAPSGEAFERAVAWWTSIASDRDAAYDDDVEIEADELTPMVTWGVNPGQSIGVSGRVPSGREPGADADAVADALGYMGLAAGAADRGDEGGRRVHRLVHELAAVGLARGGARRQGAPRRAAREGARRPGSVAVRVAAEREGLDEMFRAAGFEWRGAGCSMCLGMNPDKLEGDQVCASSSNRNFKGRQGSPDGPDAAHEPGDGGGRGDRRRGHRRAGDCER